MSSRIVLAPVANIANHLAIAGDRLLICDKFKDLASAHILLAQSPGAELAHFIIDGVLNADGTIVLLLGAADPEERDGDCKVLSVARLINDHEIEIADESFSKRIQEIAEDAVLGTTTGENNLARIESVLGNLRVVDWDDFSIPKTAQLT